MLLPASAHEPPLLPRRELEEVPEKNDEGGVSGTSCWPHRYIDLLGGDCCFCWYHFLGVLLPLLPASTSCSRDDAVADVDTEISSSWGAIVVVGLNYDRADK